MLEKNKYLFPTIAKPDDYNLDVGLTEAVKLPTMGFCMFVNPDVPEDIVYDVVKTAYEHASEMASLTTIWEGFARNPLEFNLPSLIKYSEGAPLHPGVLRYIKELGVDTEALGLE